MNKHIVQDYLDLDDFTFSKSQEQTEQIPYDEEVVHSSRPVPIILFDQGKRCDLYLTLSSIVRFVRPISEIYVVNERGHVDGGLYLKDILERCPSDTLWWPSGTGVIKRIEMDNIIRKGRALTGGPDSVLSTYLPDMSCSTIWDGWRPQRLSACECLKLLPDITSEFTRYLDRVCTLLMHLSGRESEPGDKHPTLNVNRYPLGGMAEKRIGTYTFIRWNDRGFPGAYSLIHR